MRKLYLRKQFCVGLLLLCLLIVSFGQAELGKARFDYWLNIPGGTIADLTGNENYPDNPTGTNYYTSMTAPRQFADNYGGRLSAYLVAPVTGDYTFWIASDDAGELRLSPDDDPNSAVKIAEVPTYSENNNFDQFPEQESALIPLVAGKVYYMEALVKEATGEDHLTVAWAYPGQERLIIGGDVIADANPLLASNPSPADGETGLALTGVNLSWSGPVEGFVVDPTFDVYIGTSPEGITTQLLNDSTDTSVAAGTLDYETTYYWRVDVNDPNDGSPTVRTGEVWQFTSIVPKPVITQQPKDIYVTPGDDAVLTIEAEVPVPEYPITGYEWFDVADANSPVATTQDLTLTGITEAAAYYCKVSNARGTTLSEIANVVPKRVLAHWGFENDFTDSVNGHNGAGMGTAVPTFAAGISGQAVQLDGVDQYIEVPYSSELNPAASFSISAWANISSTSSGYRAVISSRDDLPARGYILYAQDSNSWAFWTGPGWSNLTGAGVATDEWSFLTITFDVTAINSETSVIGNKRLYVNGELSAEAQDVTMDMNTAQNFQIGAGANEAEGHDFFVEGLVDEVKLYNYALDSSEVAQMYVDVYPDAVICPENPQFDLNDDCKVNLDDLKLVLAGWLECNLVPDCQ